MTSRNGGLSPFEGVAARKQVRRLWGTQQRDDELRIVITSLAHIRDPATRAWQASRLIALHPQIREIRADAVNELYEGDGMTWAEIGRLLGVQRARAWKMGRTSKPADAALTEEV
jgi:hypothetical protein